MVSSLHFMRDRRDAWLWSGVLTTGLLSAASVGLWVRQPPTSLVPNPEAIPQGVAAATRLSDRSQECGLRSLLIAATYMPNAPKVNIGEARRIFAEVTGQSSQEGCSIQNLLDCAPRFGLRPRGVEADFTRLHTWLARSGGVAILHCDGRHFVPATGVRGPQVVLGDLDRGVELVDEIRLTGAPYRWDGVAILLEGPP
jgi:ABC-type bacteriocin/lantibiotic exporter with double-glycine peptidase domain